MQIKSLDTNLTYPTLHNWSNDFLETKKSLGNNLLKPSAGRQSLSSYNDIHLDFGHTGGMSGLSSKGCPGCFQTITLFLLRLG